MRRERQEMSSRERETISEERSPYWAMRVKIA
jgi:hypothetical protein